MAIRGTVEKHTISWLKRQDQDGLLNKHISIQRKEVWDIVKKSNLILSVIMDIPIESLLFEEEGEDKHKVLDGKQRTLTLCEYLDDGFAIHPKSQVKKIEEIDMIGLKFSQLPEAMQQRITEYELSISILRALDENERAIVFFMRNQAVPLNKMDLSRVLLGEEAMTKFETLANSDFMKNKVKITHPARNKYHDIQILIEYMMLVRNPNTGFSGAEIMTFCNDIKNNAIDISDIDMDALLNYLDESVSEKKQYLKKVHLPMVLDVAGTALKNGLAAAEFGEKLDKFFEELPANTEYMATCQSGSSKAANVKKRLGIIRKAFKK